MNLKQWMYLYIAMMVLFALIGMIIGNNRVIPKPYISISKFNRIYRDQILEMITQNSDFELNLPSVDLESTYSFNGDFNQNTPSSSRKILINKDSDHEDFYLEKQTEHEKNSPTTNIPESKGLIAQLEGDKLSNQLIEFSSK